MVPAMWQQTATIVTACFALACFPGTIAGETGVGHAELDVDTDGGSDTGTEGGETGEHEGLLCIEAEPGMISCWAPYGADWALVWLDCQIEAAQVAGVLSEPWTTVLTDWGEATCYDVLLSDGVVCFVGAPGLLVVEHNDEWSPTVRDDVEAYAQHPEPC